MQSKKFQWSTFEVPRLPLEEEDFANEEKEEPSPPETFTIRHMKQGATGAVKTWPAAEVLLDYLVRRGGLRNVCDKLSADDDSGNVEGILDLTCPPSEKFEASNCSISQQSLPSSKPYNIVELGGGTGYLSVGLSLALNTNDGRAPNVRIMCTDNDRTTIKNMRHNIARQPKDRNLNKTVRIESLGWGTDVGGDKFAKLVELQFGKKMKNAQLPTSTNNNEEEPKEEDPIRLLSHIVASDVHYGATTLRPLSSIISAFKLRNPDIAVILLLKERSPNAVAQLKHEIEAKVRCGLEFEQQYELLEFSVSVRDICHRDLPNMKIVEC
eukprot:scaffold1472_cov245-Chaetoceros_neogracile.AAC.3